VRYVDTSYWVALQLRRDQHHDEARRLWQHGLGPLVTTNHVIGETWTFLRRRIGHPAASRFLAATAELPALVTRHADTEVEAEAWRWLARHEERPYSFVDAVGFATMRRLRIREALAFDGDFSAAGFVELRG
jgi:predicted nucleic acid-binding protein